MAPGTPDWLLERIILGELPAAALSAARARLEREPGGAARLARLDADSRQTLERHPPAAVAAEVSRREHQALARAAAARRGDSQGWHGLSLSIPVAASLALLFMSAPEAQPEPPESPVPLIVMLDTVRIKGGPRLRVHRQGAGEPELLGEQARARRGDVLQLSYVPGGSRHGVVVSVDGRGAVTLHHPSTLTGSTELGPGEAVPLAHSYELDDAPDFERFLFVTSEAPLEVASVLEAARALARQPSDARTLPLPLPDTLGQTSFTLEKVR
ncbi:ActD protein [Myxococcus sp. SDU36]|uniref:ActD protein n=1 Tax=Myxococcus sp. SDU36 TaxID=2831967 RepID=UPI002543B18D|nr:ActD protein [Myxococcus sp. SDU36]WIG96821.1 ActD protein [Myxococcus sp. SDU36]